ncbi:DNA polymerase III subunit delta' [Hyphobacterium sp.]|uniref:DNA polymerase III subunit delta' n=1 Tax=Hyphobacterium sp. TaxID=2004662 RepID=UPI003BA912DF
MSSAADLDPDTEEGCAPPREIEDLFGHDAAWDAFEQARQSQRMHHAWMITGPKGVGKASLAYKAAVSLLGETRGLEAAARKVRAKSHPNLLTINRPWDEKRKRWRAEITIDEVRRVPDFFSRSAGEPGWRIAIIDSMDEFNRNAANGLLKTLEEPPERGLLFLVTHSPGRLLPTIRSRCRHLELRAPEVEETADWLVRRQGIDSGKANSVSMLAKGAPGRALAFLHSGALDLEQDVRNLLDRLPNWDQKSSRRLAARVSARGAEGLRPQFFASLSRNAARLAKERAIEGLPPDAWLTARLEIEKLAGETQGLYLDTKQAALSALAHMEKAAREAR